MKATKKDRPPAGPMQLFEVVRWGNESDDPVTGGPNGPDTCYLVRAETVEQAAALADNDLRFGSGEIVAPWAHVVFLLGTDLGSGEARILRGPYVQHAYRYGWRSWDRAEPGAPWIEDDQAPPR